MPWDEEWFGEASQRALAELAQSTNHLQGDVVEVGSWQGRSTLALAAAVHPQTVNAVDTWQGSEGEISEILAAERDVHAEFMANIEGVENIKPWRMDWRLYFVEHREPIRCAFVDALHTYEEVRDQIATVVPLMVPGGVLVGDDAHHPPIQRAVLERFPAAQASVTLWIVRI